MTKIFIAMEQKAALFLKCAAFLCQHALII